MSRTEQKSFSRASRKRNTLKRKGMFKIKHGLILSLVALIALMLFPSLVTRVYPSVFCGPVTVVIDSTACGDGYARYHGLTFDNPIPRTFWKGEWYEENPDAIIGVSSGSFHYEETVDLAGGQHVLEYAVSVPPWYAYWYTTIRINGVVVAEGNVTLDDHILISFDVVHPEHELAVSLDAPSALNLGYSSLLEATVTNWGLSNETDVELFLLVDGAVVDSVTIPELLNGSSYTLGYMWTPTVEGSYNVTAYASPVSGENVTANNVVSKMVNVKELPVVYVDPEATTARLGETFVVEVKVARVTDLYGFEFKVFWDTALLDCVDCTINRIWYPNDWIAKDEILENYNATHGRYWFAYGALGPSEPPFNGDTTLVSLTFKATGLGNCTLDLRDVELVNSKAEIIENWNYVDSPYDGYVTIHSSVDYDVNGDGKVTITDIVMVALHLGENPSDPSVDINHDGKVTITDIVIVALHFGETW